MHKQIQWRIGCSGFHYPEWKEVFYPAKLPQRLWFEYYSSKFNTLELNFSFYQFPKLSSLKRWYDQSPEGFSFSLKVPRLITHYKKFSETEQLLNEFYEVIKEGLGDKLGAVLFQLPPQMHYTEAVLQQIISNMHAGYTNVVEFRHSSWWQETVYRELAAKEIIFCGISHPKLPDDLIINTGKVYYRFHGVPVLYRSAYQNSFLQKIADGIHEHTPVKEAFLFFNNTAETSALTNAKWLIQYCDSL